MSLHAFDLATATPLGSLDQRKFPLQRPDLIQLSADGRTALIPVGKPNMGQGPEKTVPHIWRVDSSEMRPIETSMDDPFDTSNGRITLAAGGDRLVLEGRRNGGREIAVELWDLKTLKTIRTAVVAPLASNEGRVKFLSGRNFHLLDPRGGCLAVPMLEPGPPEAQGSIRTEIWDAGTGATVATHPFEPMQTDPSDADFTSGLRITAAGARLVLRRDVHSHSLVDLVDGRAMAVLRSQRRLGLSPDGATAITAVESVAMKGRSDVVLCDPADGKVRATLSGQVLPSGGVSPDSRRIVTFAGGSSPALRMWDLATGRPRWAFPLVLPDTAILPDKTPVEVHFSLDSRRLLVRSNERYRVLDAESGQVLVTPDKASHDGPIAALAVRPDGVLVASAGLDHTIGLWRAGDGRYAGLIEETASPVHAVAFRPDGLTLAAGDARGFVRAWAIPKDADDAGLWSATPAWTSAADAGHSGPVRALAFSPGGDLLAAAGDDGIITLWDPAVGKRSGVLNPKAGAIRALAFRPDGSLLASAGADGTVRLWDPRSGKSVRSWPAGLADLNALVFRPDGTALAGAGNGVRLWRTDDGRPLMVVDPSVEEVRALDFSPDGNRLALGRSDRTILIVDVEGVRARLHTLSLGW